MIRRNVHLTERQIERLQLLAKKTGLTISELIRRAMDEYLNKEKVERENHGENI